MMSETYIEIIREPHPIGRQIEHDPQSWNFQADKAPQLVTTVHKRMCAPFTQTIGSCTGEATTGMLMTEPHYKPDRNLTQDDAVKIYTLATHLDRIPGYYPKEDTGSSGLAACKAAKRLGYIESYKHAFGIDHALQALVLAPVITGVNWYTGFDTPDHNGIVKLEGTIRGGHEFEVLGIDVENKLVECCQSWGPDWGLAGRFFVKWVDWGTLLAQRGDVTTVAA